MNCVILPKRIFRNVVIAVERCLCYLIALSRRVLEVVRVPFEILPRRGNDFLHRVAFEVRGFNAIQHDHGDGYAMLPFAPFGVCLV